MSPIQILENVTFKHERPTYPIFYREFYKNFIIIEDETEKGLVKVPVVLAGLFIHLTFESLITYSARTVIDMTYKHQKQNIRSVWHNIFETEHLNKKLKFLQAGIIVNNKENDAKFKIINKFISERLAPLRNNIVHGHEISRTSGTSIPTVESALLKMSSVENIKKIYLEFWENSEVFLNLFNDLIIPEGANLSSAFIPDQIKNPKDTMKRIEKEVEAEVKIVEGII